jgi:hypothetical protein
MRLAALVWPKSSPTSHATKLGERDEAPVEPADDHEGGCERIERLHVFLLVGCVPTMYR